MKINKLTTKSNKLLKVNIIKTKAYKKFHLLQDLFVEDIEHRLKKALKVIHSFDRNNKKIVFVGSSIDLANKLNIFFKNTKHLAVPYSVWKKGCLTNSLSLKKKADYKIVRLLARFFAKKPDLIVVLNNKSGMNALEESCRVKIPTIYLSENLESHNLKSNSYKVPGYFKFTNNHMRDNMFFSLVISVFKKGQPN